MALCVSCFEIFHTAPDLLSNKQKLKKRFDEELNETAKKTNK